MGLSASRPAPAPTCDPLRTTIVAIVASCLLAGAPPAAGQLPGEPFDAERFLEHVKFLASDTLAGRANGSDGLERAADYIAGRFHDAGLLPGGEDGSYFQPFEIGTAQNRRQVRNVIGVLEGADRSLQHEAVVMGAHYDHLGNGERFSLAPGGTGEIHNGADDNASGTAALIEVGRAAAADRRNFPRTLVFVAFAGEEIGLRGSAFYTRHPTVPISDTSAMINLDMIGRPNGRLLLSGLAHAPELEEDVRAASRTVSLHVEAWSEGPGDGSSDDSSFLARRVPAIGFFSGFHDDYHRPTDDWERLDVTGSLEVTRLAFELAWRIAARTRRAEFR